jgi:hypothetical protein
MILCSVAVGMAARLLADPVLQAIPCHATRGGIQFFSTGGNTMNALKTLAIVLIVAGALGLVYGSFTYTKDTHEAKLGPIELSVKDKETVNIPVWAGVGAILIGGILLLTGSKKG